MFFYCRITWLTSWQTKNMFSRSQIVKIFHEIPGIRNYGQKIESQIFRIFKQYALKLSFCKFWDTYLQKSIPEIPSIWISWCTLLYQVGYSAERTMNLWNCTFKIINSMLTLLYTIICHFFTLFVIWTSIWIAFRKQICIQEL